MYKFDIIKLRRWKLSDENALSSVLIIVALGTGNENMCSSTVVTQKPRARGLL